MAKRFLEAYEEKVVRARRHWGKVKLNTLSDHLENIRE